MNILVNEQNEIVAYTNRGDIDGATAYSGAVPDGFEANFTPSFYLLKYGVIMLNPNYADPAKTTPVVSPTAEQQAITALAQRLADQQSNIESLEQAMTALAQGGSK